MRGGRDSRHDDDPALHPAAPGGALLLPRAGATATRYVPLEPGKIRVSSWSWWFVGSRYARASSPSPAGVHLVARRGRRFWRWPYLALLTAIALPACGSDPTAVGPPSACPSPLAQTASGDAVIAVQEAVHCSGGYRVVVTGHNLVLPGWGGVDSATVDVSTADLVAAATLQRTGDGVYALIRVNGQTYFKRSTCDHFARVNGGGAMVLEPFLLGISGVLQSAPDASAGALANGTVSVGATLKEVGPVKLSVDPTTDRPVQLTAEKPESGTVTSWTFTAWGSRPDVQAPAGQVPDQGPGGNPC